MLPKAHLTSHSKMSVSRWVITPSWLSESLRPFLYSSSLYSCHLLLISSDYIRSISFLSFIVPIFAWNIPLVFLIFLKRTLVFPILLFSSYFFALITEEGFFICPCYSLELCIQMGISFLFSFVFTFSSFLSCCVRPPQTTILPCCISFWGEMVLVTTCCTMSQSSVHSSSGTLSIRSNLLNLFVTSTV